jgi:hypothetical protein
MRCLQLDWCFLMNTMQNLFKSSAYCNIYLIIIDFCIDKYLFKYYSFNYCSLGNASGSQFSLDLTVVAVIGPSDAKSLKIDASRIRFIQNAGLESARCGWRTLLDILDGIRVMTPISKAPTS